MKINGQSLSIIRGETASILIRLLDEDGAPFRLPEVEVDYTILRARFVVKKNAYDHLTTKADFLIDKILDLNDAKRFADVDIIDLSTETGYNALIWDDAVPPDNPDDYLYYHPGLKEYAYYDSIEEAWIPYSLDLIIPFEISDTVGLEYRTYYYDLSIEASDIAEPEDDDIEYRRMLVEQAPFVVSYKV